MAYVTADIIIVPIGTDSTSISDYVAVSEKALQGFTMLKTKINPMSTTLEGELKDVLEAVQAMHEAPFNIGAKRLSTSIRIDDRRDTPSTIEHKLKTIHEKTK
ncbi:MAG: MTH1187 family thiamine-binding protein [Cyanobacteria bacterium]|nr:MTH1187 family thiamine-binding protein [Cyanobacteriota bacterium]